MLGIARLRFIPCTLFFALLYSSAYSQDQPHLTVTLIAVQLLRAG